MNDRQVLDAIDSEYSKILARVDSAQLWIDILRENGVRAFKR